MTNYPAHAFRTIGRDFRAQLQAWNQNEFSEAAVWSALYKAFADSRLRPTPQELCYK